MNLLDGTHGALSDQRFMARVEDENEEAGKDGSWKS